MTKPIVSRALILDTVQVEHACLETIRAADRQLQSGRADALLPIPDDPLGMLTASLWRDLGDVAGMATPLYQRRQPTLNSWRRVAMVAALVVVPITGLLLIDRGEVYETRIGERKTVALADGSSIMLNTGSRVLVRYGKATREIDLDRGEAVFTVRADIQRPFTVTTDRESITAVGTAFQVRRDSNTTEITLLKGKVQLHSDKSGASTDRILGLPGSYVRLTNGTIIAAGRVDPVATLAWQRGELVLDTTPLATAIAEMNRYTTAQIVLAPGLARGRQLTGIFKTGAPLPFARTVASVYGFSLTVQPGRYVLTEPSKEYLSLIYTESNYLSAS
jgi:transmembrane sensor